MENKEDIVKRLKLLLISTRAGSNIADLILNEKEDKVTILFRHGGIRRGKHCRRFWLCNYYGCNESNLT